MTPQHLEQLIRQGEGVTLEFKQSHEKLNRDVYETVCAFLNRQGGKLLFGVTDNGTVCATVFSAKWLSTC
jgi:ATP-dependent DNA helicase RecG